MGAGRRFSFSAEPGTPARVLAVLLGLAVAIGGGFITYTAQAAPTGEPDDGKASVKELKLRNAWVPKNAPLQFGKEPLDHVTAAANDAAGGASCSISPEVATALTLAMTWPETSPSGEPPSPMTLSRYDTQPTLGDPQGRAEGLWFHPGIGVWQLDSAGLGSDFTAGEAMDTQNAAGRMAPYIVGKYCDAVNGGASEADARNTAWRDWVACWEGACENIYQRILAEGVTPVDGVGQYGGGELRDCDFGGTQVQCLFVDPAKAQGANWWADPAGGNSPVAAPFYVFKQEADGQVNEVRYWLAADSGAATDVSATRPFGANARDSLTWTEGTGFCDRTSSRGAC